MSSSQPPPKTITKGPGLVRQNAIVHPPKGSALTHSPVVREVRAPAPAPAPAPATKKGGKRLRRSRSRGRGATKKHTPKPKWASTRRRKHGGACGCAVRRSI